MWSSTGFSIRNTSLLIYINDIDEYIVSKLEKFAEETKLCKGISNKNYADILRSDLNKIYQRSLDW